MVGLLGFGPVPSVPTIHPNANSGVPGWLDAGHEPRRARGCRGV